jgi:hypothetical protein
MCVMCVKAANVPGGIERNLLLLHRCKLKEV